MTAPSKAQNTQSKEQGMTDEGIELGYQSSGILRVCRVNPMGRSGTRASFARRLFVKIISDPYMSCDMCRK